MPEKVPHIIVYPTPKGILVRVGSGRFSQEDAEVLAKAAGEKGPGEPREIVLNILPVDSFQSAALATVARLAFDHRLKVVCADPKITKLLDLVGILPAVEVADKEQAFIAEPPPPRPTRSVKRPTPLPKKK
ncbi:MAG: hypothetical protein L0216_15260 [Planctomycetales bacterium]|nr:hypothetical protein [Planctomycetales bacterium]